MAISAPIFLNGVEVTNDVKKFVQASVALKSAKSAEEISKLKQMKMNAVQGVASALTDLIPDDKTRQIASTAFDTYFLVHEVTTTTVSSASIGAILGIIGGAFGVMAGIAGILGAFGGKRKVYVEFHYHGTVELKVDFSGGTVKLVPSLHTISDNVHASEGILNSIKAYCDDVNSAIANVEIQDIEFVKKYLPRPRTDVFTIHIDVSVGGDVGDKGDVKKLMRKFTRKLVEELNGKVVSKIREIGEAISALVFLQAIGAQDRINTMAVSLLPDLGYQVEGMWRKELERLSIKLTRTREYYRQIEHAIRASVIKILLDVVKNTPRSGSASVDKVTLINQILNAVKNNVELRYGMDLIGWGRIGEYKPNFRECKIRQDVPPDAVLKRRLNVFGYFETPTIFLQGYGDYIFKPVVKDGKIQIVYVRKKGELLPRHYTKYWGSSYGYASSKWDKPEPGDSTCFPCGFLYHKVDNGAQLLPWHPEEFTDALIDKILRFVNYLLGEIPREAVEYISKNVGTVEGYIWYWKILSIKAYKVLWEGDLWRIFSSPRSKYTAVENIDTRCVWHYFAHVDKSIRHGHDLSVYYKGVQSIDFPAIGEDITNIPRVLNAIMQDIVDAYNFWLKGYAVEWKKRVQTKLFEEALPSIRQSLLPYILKVADMYANLPSPSTDVGIDEMYSFIISKMSDTIEQIRDYPAVIKNNKDFIVSMFGVEEYERLLQEAEQYQKLLSDKIQDMFKDIKVEDLKKIDLNYLNSLAQNELEALNDVVESIKQNLLSMKGDLESRKSYLESVYNKLYNVCSGG